MCLVILSICGIFSLDGQNNWQAHPLHDTPMPAMCLPEGGFRNLENRHEKGHWVGANCGGGGGAGSKGNDLHLLI